MLRWLFHVCVSLWLLYPAALLAQDGREQTLRAGYGPLTLCIGEYAVDIREGEAGLMRSRGSATEADSVSIIGAHGTLYAGIASRFEDDDAPARTRAIRLSSGLAATRRDARAHSGYRAGIPGEVVYTTFSAHRDYQLPLTTQGLFLMVSAEAFNRRSDTVDRALLARIHPRHAVPPGANCARPPLADSDNPAWQRDPRRWEGPQTLCSNDMSIMLLSGESLQYGWPTDQTADGIRVWHVRVPTGEVHIIGGAPGWGRVPVGTLLDHGWTLRQSEPGSTMLVPSPELRQRYPGFSPIYATHAGVSHADVAELLRRLSFPASNRQCRRPS